MAADSRLTLPGDFDPDRRYLLKGETLIEWRTRIIADRAIPGPGLTETVTPTGRVLTAELQQVTPAAFYHQYLAQAPGSDPEDPPHYYLQGGSVSAGTGNIDVPDLDIATAGSEPVDHTLLWLECTGDGIVEDGVLLPGFDLTSVDYDDGLALPSNTLPEADDEEDKVCHLLLGRWLNAAFIPSSPGNIQITACPGSYTASRI